MIEENTFKFGKELKPTKANWKSQIFKNRLICWNYKLFTKSTIDTGKS